MEKLMYEIVGVIQHTTSRPSPSIPKHAKEFDFNSINNN